MAITRVWIEDGCVSCGQSEANGTKLKNQYSCKERQYLIEVLVKIIGIIGIFIFVISGCASLPGMASVPMESAQITKVAKQFDPPSDGMAGLYIYRNTSFGGASHINVWVDSNCIGTTAPYVFFYEEVEGGISYSVSSAYTWAEPPQTTRLLKLKAV